MSYLVFYLLGCRCVQCSQCHIICLPQTFFFFYDFLQRALPRQSYTIAACYTDRLTVFLLTTWVTSIFFFLKNKHTMLCVLRPDPKLCCGRSCVTKHPPITCSYCKVVGVSNKLFFQTPSPLKHVWEISPQQQHLVARHFFVCVFMCSFLFECFNSFIITYRPHDSRWIYFFRFFFIPLLVVYYVLAACGLKSIKGFVIAEKALTV